MSRVCGVIPNSNICVIGGLDGEKRENRAENIFPKFDEWQKSSASTSSANSKKDKYKENYSQHIIVKLLKNRDEEKIFKVQRKMTQENNGTNCCWSLIRNNSV